MNDRLRAHGSVLRIARLLDTGADQVAFLDDVDVDALDELTDQITATLFDPGSDRLRGLRVAANLLPVPVAATIGERAMGPVLCALLVGAVDDDRLIAIARRLPPPFLAEVAVHIDPRRVPAVIASLPPATVGATAGHLATAGEYATLGLFVDHLGDEASLAAVEALDGEALLRSVTMARAAHRIDHIVGQLDEDRLSEILLAAHREQAWLEALSLVAALSDEQRTRLADVAIEAEEPVVDDLVTYAFEEDLLEPVLGLIGSVSEPNLATLAAIAPLGRSEVVAAIVRAADDGDRWADLLPIAKHLPDATRLQLAAIVGDLDPRTLDRVIAVANANGLHHELVVLLGLLSEDEQDQVVDAALTRTAKQRTWADLLPMVALLPEATQARLAAQAEALSDRDLSAFVRTVEGAELWEPALQLVAQLAGSTQDRLLTPMARLSERSRIALGAQVDALELRERIGALADLLAPPDPDDD